MVKESSGLQPIVIAFREVFGRMNQRKAGVLLTYLAEAAQILSSLIYTPIMLRLMSQSEYGLYQLVWSVVYYLSLLSLGFTSAYLRFHARAVSQEGEDGAARLNGMFLVIFSVISVICLLCGAFMLTNMRLIFGDKLTEAEFSTARILMVMMVFNMALSFISSVFDCILAAHEQFIVQKSLSLARNVLSPFISLPLLLLGFGSVSLAVTTTVVTVAAFAVNVYYCLKKLRTRFCFRGFRPALLREMWVFTFFIFLSQIIDQINWGVDRLLLGRFSGAAAVAVYGVGAEFNNMYRHFSVAISAVFAPMVNRMVTEHDDHETLTQVFTRVGRIQFLVMALILSGFIFVGHPFIVLWAGAEYADSYLVAVLLIAPVTVPLIQNLGIEIQRARNQHKSRSLVFLAISVLNVIISIPLIRAMGPSGAALGTAIALLLGDILFMNWYYHCRMHLDMRYFWANIGRMALGLIPPLLFGLAMMRFFTISSYLGVFLFAGAYCAVYGASAWLFSMNGEEKEMVHSLLGRVLRVVRR